MAVLAGLGGETWFRLGDGDLAIHVERTRRLSAGEPLSSIIRDFGGASASAPNCADERRSGSHARRTAAGWLDFQRYFVEQQCRPEVTEFSYGGAPTAKPHPDFVAALAHPELRAVVICPSNPFISIEPILTVPGVREALLACAAPVVAVAPIVGDQAIKGPTAKMMRELGLRISAETVAERYADILDGYVVDDGDAPLLATLPIPAIAAKAVMVSLADREQLRENDLDWPTTSRARVTCAFGLKHVGRDGCCREKHK